MFFLLLGIGFLVIGVLTQTGVFKGWWLTTSSPVSPRNIVFSSYPIGLVCFLISYLAESNLPNDTRLQLVDCVGIPLILLAITLTAWQPNWLKPRWLRWLETHHRPILPLLREEARNDDWSSWGERVTTQEGLEEWVAEVRRKHSLN